MHDIFSFRPSPFNSPLQSHWLSVSNTLRLKRQAVYVLCEWINCDSSLQCERSNSEFSIHKNVFTVQFTGNKIRTIMIY